MRGRYQDLGTGPRGSVDGSLKEVGRPVRFDRNTEIQADGEPADYFHQVVSGAVRIYKVLDDGRRQIGAFHLPDDVIEL